MGFPACLIRRHNHLRALSVLGLPLEKPTFPAVVQCPHCQQNTLHIFDDILTDGLWLNCAACSCHGDIITFGANLWNLSLPNTLAKFSATGVITENDADRVIGDYDRAIAKQNAAEAFWKDAESQVWNHGDDVIACRLRDLGVKNEINGCYGLVGVTHHDQISKICSELGRAKPSRLRAAGAALVLPFYDLPGRLVGFSIWQYDEDNEKTQQNFIGISGVRKKKQEAGYFLLSTLLGQTPTVFKGTQFISSDALWVLRVQCDYLARHGQTMPIAASYSGAEAESYGATWAGLPTGSRIFHQTMFSPELISRACNARGYVAVVPTERQTKPYGKAIDHYVLGRLASMRSNAKTWQHALRDATVGVSELSAQAFMQRLTISPDKLAIFLDKHADTFSSSFKSRVLSSIKMSLAAPTRTQKRRIVLERDTGWWNQVGQQIANVRVTISKVLQADTGDKMYCGSIYMEDQEYTFNDSAKRIERMGLLAYAAAVMAPHGKLVVFDRAWNKTSHMIAMQLRPPELINVATRSGWDENTNTFRFAKYELTHAGEVRQTHTWLSRRSSKPFPEPVPIAPLSVRDLLTPSHENSFVWAFVSAIIGNLVAPIVRQDYIATAVPTKTFDVARRIADALFCPIEQTTIFQRRNSHKFLSSITDTASWPVLGCSAFDDAVFGPHVPKYFNRALLLRLPHQAAVTALGYGWQAIKEAPAHTTTDFEVLRYVLPAYLQRALKHRMQAFARGGNIHKAVLADMHKWLFETYGATFNLPHMQNLVAYPADAHVELMKELNYAISAGKISVLPVPRSNSQKGDYILRKKHHWWLNRRAVDRYFYTARSAGPNWLAIIELLQQSNVYAGEDVVHNMTGLLINAEWCDQFLIPAGESLEKETG